MVWQAHFLSTNSEVKPLPLCEWWWMCGLTGVPRQCRHSAPQQLPQGATWRGVVCAGLQRGGPALEVPPEFRESCCWASSFLREVIINGSCSYHLLKYSGCRPRATCCQMVESHRTGCESQPHHSPAGWLWARGCSSLGFSFFWFEVETVIHPIPMELILKSDMIQAKSWVQWMAYCNLLRNIASSKNPV